MPVPEDFPGTWRIKREIDDVLTGNKAAFAGTATIEPAERLWVYREAGHLTLSGAAPMQAERRYFWQPVSGGFDVYFDDQRFFHHFSLGPKAQAGHWCDPDQYDVRYDVSDWPVWSSRWAVQGPRKNYVMRSVFEPAT